MWPEDACFVERNSRDFISRNDRINANAEAVCEVLRKSPMGKPVSSNGRLLLTIQIVKRIYYPKYAETKANYDAFKYASGGYGGLLSVTFHTIDDAKVFFDCLRTEKGPSLGTNFTLTYYYRLLCRAQLILAQMSVCDFGTLQRIGLGTSHTIPS